MTYLLIFYLLFLFVYIAFNVYGIFRISSLRIAGDVTGIVLFLYSGILVFIILISLLLLNKQEWNFSNPWRLF